MSFIAFVPAFGVIPGSSDQTGNHFPETGGRRRVDRFEVHTALIPQWLEAEPDVANSEQIVRLIALAPERFGTQYKRTLLRRIRDSRVARVQ